MTTTTRILAVLLALSVVGWVFEAVLCARRTDQRDFYQELSWRYNERAEDWRKYAAYCQEIAKAGKVPLDYADYKKMPNGVP